MRLNAFKTIVEEFKLKVQVKKAGERVNLKMRFLHFARNDNKDIS